MRGCVSKPSWRQFSLRASLGAWAAVLRQGRVSVGPLLLMRYSVACNIYVPGHGP